MLEFDVNLYVISATYLLMVIGILNDARRISQLRRRLLSVHPIEHRLNYKHGIFFRIFKLLNGFGPIFALVIVLIVYSTSDKDNSRPLSEMDSSIPVLSLADIAPEQYEHCSGSFYTRYTPLVPVQYVVTYRTQDDNLNHPWATLQTNYYETVLPSLSQPIFDEITEIYPIFYELPNNTQPIDTVLFDEAVYIQSNYAQYIIAYRDKTVVVVRYEGDEDLRDKLETIADAFF